MTQYYVDQEGNVKPVPDSRSFFDKLVEGLSAGSGEYFRPGTAAAAINTRDANLTSALNRFGEQGREQTFRTGERLGSQDFTTSRDATQFGYQNQLADKAAENRTADIMRENRMREENQINQNTFTSGLHQQDFNQRNLMDMRRQVADFIQNQQNNAAALERAKLMAGSRETVADIKNNNPATAELLRPLSAQEVEVLTVKLTPEQRAIVAQAAAAGTPITQQLIRSIASGPAAQGSTINLLGTPTSGLPAPKSVGGGNLQLP